jgi:type I site-specific restriction endonuclease
VTNEAFARIKIDQLLKDTEWRLTDGLSVRYEYPLDDGGRADYVLFDRQGRALAVLEAKSTSLNLSAGEAQGRHLKSILSDSNAKQKSIRRQSTNGLLFTAQRFGR